MTFARTVLGDVEPAEMGATYAHEHLVIDGGVAKLVNPEISLQRVSDAVAELAPCVAAGLGAVVDAMPADAGRNVAKLAEISRRAGVHVVAATGLHHARYYGERHWGELLEPVSADEVRQAAQESLDWSLRQPADDEFARGTAVRSRHYLEHGEWITKKEASE